MNRNILMLEHDEDDRYITQAVFDEHNYDIQLHFVNSGREVFDHLSGCERKKERLPSLILLNYHASPVNAVEIIKELKNTGPYVHIPVIVLSGSVNADIIKECYVAGACSFIQKPWRSEEADVKINNFFHYWFETVELPN
jgi:CheY-like chemotaxis protein